MAEDRSRATGEQGGHPEPLSGYLASPDRIYTPEEAVKTAGPDAMPDRIRGVPEREQLAVGDDAKLRPDERPDRFVTT